MRVIIAKKIVFAYWFPAVSRTEKKMRLRITSKGRLYILISSCLLNKKKKRFRITNKGRLFYVGF